jgi:pullulanase
LRTAADIGARVQFFNGGPDPVPGLIAMVIRDEDGAVDPQHDLVAVLVNSAPGPQTLAAPALSGRRLLLHPVHLFSPDPVAKTARFDRATGTFSIPGRTAVVFWSPRRGPGGR